MKKLLYTCILALFAFTSCITDVDDVFDQTASERLQEQLDECKSLLISNPNGWLIQYYPSYDRAFGGFNFVAKFGSDGFVEIAGDIASFLDDDITNMELSHYTVNASSGVVLTFDTYNKYFHYLSDPDFTTANNYGGDYTFTYVSGTSEELVFKGIKTENTILFKALSSENEGIEYLQSVQAMKEAVVSYSTYTWQDDNGNNFSLMHNEDAIASVLEYYVTSSTASTTSIPYIFTATGIEFYSPVTVNGVTAQNFTWNTASNTFQSTDAFDASATTLTVTLTPQQSESYISYDDVLGTWNMAYYEGTVPVTFAENVRGRSFIMKGLDYDIVVNYQRFGQYISILAQYLSSSEYLYAWNANSGYLNYITTVGMNFSLRPNSTQKILVGSDNGLWGTYTVDSFYAMDLITGGMIFWLPYITQFSK